jgi:predicted RNase H-like HicB family nuclease
VRGEAKPCQIRQVLRLIERYALEGGAKVVTDYHINVFYSDEDGGYIADVPDLEACSGFGGTRQAALAEVELAKDAWLAAAQEAGQPIPEPRYRPAMYAP